MPPQHLYPTHWRISIKFIITNGFTSSLVYIYHPTRPLSLVSLTFSVSLHGSRLYFCLYQWLCLNNIIQPPHFHPSSVYSLSTSVFLDASTISQRHYPCNRHKRQHFRHSIIIFPLHMYVELNTRVVCAFKPIQSSKNTILAILHSPISPHCQNRLLHSHLPAIFNIITVTVFGNTQLSR